MLYLFDVDGTLVRSFMNEGGAVDDYDKVELLPGRLLWFQQQRQRVMSQSQAPHVALITNQAGVAFGYQTEDQVRAKMGLVCAKLHFFYGLPFSVHMAFCHPKAKDERYLRDDDYRKPGPGMLYEAMALHRRNRAQTLFVGDMETDQRAAYAAGVTYLTAEEFFGQDKV